MNALFTPEDLAATVDELAAVKAQIADLQETENNLKALLVAAELDAIDGNQHRAAISWSSRTLINWQAVAMKLNPSSQLITAYTTKTAPAPTVRVTARKTS